MEIEEIFNLCKSVFPKAGMKEGKIRLTKGSGWHNPNVALYMLHVKKIEMELQQAVDNGATDIVRSKTSKSVYYSLNGKSFRISDHIKSEFEGEQKIITL